MDAPMRAPGTLKLWVPVAAVALLLVAYAYFYELSATEAQGSASIGLANVVGLAAVIVGLIVAGMVFRRGTPADRSPDPRNP
jgi:hypothetical protein